MFDDFDMSTCSNLPPNKYEYSIQPCTPNYLIYVLGGEVHVHGDDADIVGPRPLRRLPIAVRRVCGHGER